MNFIMKRKTLLKRTGLAIVILILAALSIFYLWSNAIINRTYPVPLANVNVPTDSASVKEGERLLHIEHCSDCHGARLTGQIFPDAEPLATLVAPNLTRIIPTYSNAEIERLLRDGVKKDGRSIFVMPSFMFRQLKEESILKIIAYLRTIQPLPTTPGLPRESTFHFSWRLKLIEGDIQSTASMINPNSPRLYIPKDTTRVSFGRYLAMTACTACHGTDLKGEEGFSPNLIIASAYSEKDFFRLIRTGTALGDRKDIGMMSRVAKNNLSYLNDQEISSIYAYLKTKPTMKDEHLK
jgi:mono/diheme cytochrome c family protein